MSLFERQTVSILAAEAIRETGSKQARRLVEYLLCHDVATTTQIARDCSIGNISAAANYIRPALERRGLTIVASLPKPLILNRFGEQSQTHEWRLTRLR